MIKRLFSPVEPSKEEPEIPFINKLYWFVAFSMIGLAFVATMAYALRRILLLAQ